MARVPFNDNLKALFRDPVGWVRALSEQAGEKEGERLIVLDDHFLITFKAPKPAGEGEELHVLVEGISGSGLLVIRPKFPVGQQDFRGLLLSNRGHGFADGLGISGLQENLLNKPDVTPVEITVSEEFGLVFAHYEVTSDDDSEEAAAEKIADHVFLLSANDGISKLADGWSISHSRRFVGPLNVEETNTVRAMKVEEGRDPSDILFVYEGSRQSLGKVCSKIVGRLSANDKFIPESITLMRYPPGKNQRKLL